MRKILTVVIMVSLLCLVGCVQDDTYSLDHSKTFFDDFNEGIDANDWEIGHQQWGVGNNGVSYQNVNYTTDGVVVLQANGDYYDGSITGPTGRGTRTGAVIITNQALGPGSFEVRMKALPRFGATTAIWTYYYEDNLNHEIDIELNINNSFNDMMTTNWLTLNDKFSKTVTTDVIHNDGQWHTYKFEWQTSPKKEIRYYLDGVKVSSDNAFVPDHAGRFWIGHWFPDAWAGTPDFETDYMYIDWIKYVPYKNQEYVRTNAGNGSIPSRYPQAPIDYPVANLVSNAGFEGNEEAWQTRSMSDAVIVDNDGVLRSKAMEVPANDYAYQEITGIHENFDMTLRGRAKIALDGEAKIVAEYHPLNVNPLGSEEIVFKPTDSNYQAGKYFEHEMKLTIPAGTKRIELYLKSTSGISYFDDIFLNLTAKTPPPQTIPDDNTNVYTVNFETSGGNIIAPYQNVLGGSVITAPTNPSRTGFIFQGWYKEANLVNSWDFVNDRVNANITLYAKWEAEGNIFYDDFSSGVQPSKWRVHNQKWGAGNGTANDGVIYQNVNVTKDNILVLTGNGEYYAGNLNGIEFSDGKKTGAAISTRETFGPGKFEVRMKAFPRFGSTTAMWTYYYGNGLNHEIDIELAVEGSFRNAWFTNWLTETNSAHVTKDTIVNNDGQWHTYRFDWHTGPNARIEYYIDDVHYHTATTKIPDRSGNFWIGNWFPNNWAGNPNFETDHMFVDWVKISPFDEPFVKTPDSGQSTATFYPTTRIDMPVSNWISNAKFDGDIRAWRMTNATIQNGFLKITGANGRAVQEITALDETFAVTLFGKARLNGNNGKIDIVCYNRNNQVTGTITLDFKTTDANYIAGSFYQNITQFNLPAGTTKAEVILSGANVDFDDLFFNLTSRTVL